MTRELSGAHQCGGSLELLGGEQPQRIAHNDRDTCTCPIEPTEIALKAAADRAVLKTCRPVLVGSRAQQQAMVRAIDANGLAVIERVARAACGLVEQGVERVDALDADGIERVEMLAEGCSGPTESGRRTG